MAPAGVWEEHANGVAVVLTGYGSAPANPLTPDNLVSYHADSGNSEFAMLTAPVSVDERSVNTAVDANGRASLPKQTETPWQSDNDRSGETTDIDGTDNGLDDSSADNPSGNDPHSRRFDVVRCPNRREISHLTP